MLVERGGELLADLGELLAEGMGLESKGVPFVLEGSKEGGDGSKGWRARADGVGSYRRSFELVPKT